MKLLRTTPDELLALSNEINDSMAILGEVQRVHDFFVTDQTVDRRTLLASTQDLLRRASLLWENLRDPLNMVVPTSPSVSARWYKSCWLRHRDRAKLIQDGLRDVRTAIHEILCTVHVSLQFVFMKRFSYPLEIFCTGMSKGVYISNGSSEGDSKQ